MAEQVQVAQQNQDDITVEENQDNWFKSQAPDVQDYIQKLRKENASNRVKRNEVDSKYEEAVKKADELDKLREETSRQNGEFEKLYTAEKEKVTQLSGLQDKIASYENTFTTQFETAKKDLSDVQVGLIEDSNMSIEKKLEWAIKLKSENNINVDSPSSERPGDSLKNSTSLLENYKKGDMEQRSQILFETKKSNPKLYAQLISL